MASAVDQPLQSDVFQLDHFIYGRLCWTVRLNLVTHLLAFNSMLLCLHLLILKIFFTFVKGFFPCCLFQNYFFGTDKKEIKKKKY